MLVNIMFFSVSASFISAVGEFYGHFVMLSFSLIALFLVIIFGEVAPKSIAIISPKKFLKLTAIPLFVIHKLVFPIRYGLRKITILIELILNKKKSITKAQVDELRMILQASSEDGALSEIEASLIGELIDFSDTKVREFMTPRVDLTMAESCTSAEEILKIAKKYDKSKIPIYRETRDNIIGYVNAYELFFNNACGYIEKYLKPIVFISEYQHADNVLKLFLERKINIAIVVDEYGGTAGTITYTDLVEEIFGEGTFDDKLAEPPIKNISNNEFIISGRLGIREWKNLFGFKGELPTVNTVGGLMTSLLGDIPKIGDTVILGWVKMSVMNVNRRQIISLKLEIQNVEITTSGESKQ